MENGSHLPDFNKKSDDFLALFADSLSHKPNARALVPIEDEIVAIRANKQIPNFEKKNQIARLYPRRKLSLG